MNDDSHIRRGPHAPEDATVRAGHFELVLADGHPEVALEALSGIGPKTAVRLQARDIVDQRDLLLLLPRRYKKLLRNASGRGLVDEQPANASFQAVVVSVRKPGKWDKRPLEVVVDLDGERVVLVWFNMKHGRFVNAFQVGRWLSLDGALVYDAPLPKMTHPNVRWLTGEPESRPEQAGFDPVYPGAEGISPKLVRGAIEQSYMRLHDFLVDVIPGSTLKELELPTIREALETLHLLRDFEDVDVLELALERSRHRLVYEEFFTLQSHFARERSLRRAHANAPRLADRELGRAFVRSLPFGLTGDQRGVAGLLADELQRPFPMRRLLQGDVGAGKTVVAFMAAALASGSGAQVAILAPTEVLATQHQARARQMLEPVGVRSALLTGSTSAADRTDILARLRGGEIDVLIGTHAVFSDDVEYANLGLVVIDEQHKFGVEQRETLLGKGDDPHLLAMTATPIPRSLAHTAFGDLELAVLREKPPGREPIRTHLRDRDAREKVFTWMRDEIIAKGQQAYVVYPAIEPDARGFRALLPSAEALANGLLRGVRLGVLHGRMGTDDKLQIMERFESGEVDVLCSTTVIEVGVDVANATVMVIESPEAFGLSQLHQLRGRVGRGQEASRCVLLAGHALTENARERLMSLATTDDGFELAEIDLLMRGPGEFLGVRQAGAAEFRFGDVIRDLDWLVRARKDALQHLSGDMASTL